MPWRLYLLLLEIAKSDKILKDQPDKSDRKIEKRNIGIEMISKKTIENDFKDFFGVSGRKKDYIVELIVAKTRGLKNCSVQIIDSIPKFDLLIDPEYGIIKVLIRASYYDEYKVSIGERGFDTLFVVGINRDKKVIENVYAIPEKELTGKKYITLTKTGPTYQKFKIDEKPYIQTYNNIIKGKYSMLDDNDIKLIL